MDRPFCGDLFLYFFSPDDHQALFRSWLGLLFMLFEDPFVAEVSFVLDALGDEWLVLATG